MNRRSRIQPIIDLVPAAAIAAYGLGYKPHEYLMPPILSRKRKALDQKVSSIVKKAKKALGYQAGRSIYRQPKTELKAFDIAQSASLFTTAGVFTVLNAPINGSELYQRVGRKIYMKSIHIKGFITNAATAVQDIGRILLVYDAQPNAALPPLAALLQDSNAAAATTGLSQINLTNRARFKILRDHQTILPAVTNTAGVLTNGPSYAETVPASFDIEWFVKLNGLETVYNSGAAGTVADITSGSLFLCTVSSNASSQWGLGYTTRLRYYD